MSTLKVDAIRHNSATSDAITTASDGTCTAQLASVNGGQLSHRNMIINGGMMISQKGSSVAITGGSNSYPLIDRFMAVANSSMTYNVTISQEADNPDGLGKSFKSLTTSAKTPSGSENYIIRQRLEEQDIRGVGFGTSACKKSTLTFWVKSNKTGTYSVMVYLAGFSINLLTTYTISAQNTWEKKTISIPAYTTSYTHPGDTAAGLTFDWHLSSGPDDIVSPHSWSSAAGNARAATGQVNILDTVNNYWQLANVQYEVGEVSTPFEYRSFGEELARCQRYYYRHIDGTDDVVATATCYQNNNLFPIIDLPVTMRTEPSIDVANGTSYFTAYSNGGSDGFNTFSSMWNPSTNTVGMNAYSNDGVSGRDAGHSVMIISSHASCYLGFNAEL